MVRSRQIHGSFYIGIIELWNCDTVYKTEMSELV